MGGGRGALIPDGAAGPGPLGAPLVRVPDVNSGPDPKPVAVSGSVCDSDSIRVAAPPNLSIRVFPSRPSLGPVRGSVFSSRPTLFVPSESFRPVRVFLSRPSLFVPS